MNAPQHIKPMENASMKVDGWVDRLGGWTERHQRFAIGLGNWESRLLADKLGGTSLPDNPIYISGLARSGSTILLELLSQHPGLASHRYRDFPPVFTPWLWNWFVDRAAMAPERPAERAHKDRLVVTSESPEALEEPVWMAFFPQLHQGKGNEALDQATTNPAFETFYRNHQRKLMLVRGGGRYLAKANYNVTRLPYLIKLFPRARFIIPIRDPIWHVASLMKQHALFCREAYNDPRIADHLRRTGHFEFGPGRKAVSLADSDTPAAEALWCAGCEAAGWAQLWANVYGHVRALIADRQDIRDAVMIVRYEDLCTHPRETVAEVMSHCGISDERLPALAAQRLSAPTYYRPDFSDEERREILARTADTAKAFGYPASPRARRGAPANADVRKHG
jgi:hypothetical protein